MPEVKLSTVDLSPFLNGPRAGTPDFPTDQQKAVSRVIDSAFRTNGFFLLNGHGISTEDVKGMFEISRELFSMSDEQKRSRLTPIEPVSNVGYLCPGLERLNPRRPPDPKEAFNFKFQCNVQDQDFSGCPPGFEGKARSFWERVTYAGDVLSEACALALGLPGDYFVNTLGPRQNSTFRLLHYPGLPADNWQDVVRTGEHTDFGLFTLLFTQGPGLQARAVRGGDDEDTRSVDHEHTWLDVPVAPAPVAIVNGGALLGRWTNDHWMAAAHRVMAPREMSQARQSRFSIACFIDPFPECVVDVHDNLLGDGEKARYEAITAGGYLQSRLDEAQGKDRRGTEGRVE